MLLGVGVPTMKRSFLFVLGLAAVCYAREWTDDTGAFTVDAEFDRVEGDSVWLVRPNGRKLKVSLSRLSEADQDFIKKTGEQAKPVVLAKQLASTVRSALVGSAFQETDVRAEAIEAKAVKQLAHKFGGQLIELQYPISNVVPDQNGYVLQLDDPAPAVSVTSYRRLNDDEYSISWHPDRFSVDITQDEAVSINRRSKLVLSGRIVITRTAKADDLIQSDTVLVATSPRTKQSFVVSLEEITHRILRD